MSKTREKAQRIFNAVTYNVSHMQWTIYEEQKALDAIEEILNEQPLHYTDARDGEGDCG